MVAQDFCVQTLRFEIVEPVVDIIASLPDIIVPVPVLGPAAAAPPAKHQRRRNTPFHPPPPKPALKVQTQPVDK